MDDLTDKIKSFFGKKPQFGGAAHKLGSDPARVPAGGAAAQPASRTAPAGGLPQHQYDGTFRTHAPPAGAVASPPRPAVNAQQQQRPPSAGYTISGPPPPAGRSVDRDAQAAAALQRQQKAYGPKTATRPTARPWVASGTGGTGPPPGPSMLGFSDTGPSAAAPLTASGSLGSSGSGGTSLGHEQDAGGSSSSTGVAVQPSTAEQYGSAGMDEEQLQSCIAMVVSNPAGGTCVQTLSKLLGNILAKPDEPKFRQIRLSNAKIQETLVNVSGALELLQCVGFQFSFPEGSDGDIVQGFFFLPGDCNLHALQVAFQHIQQQQQQQVLPATAIVPDTALPPSQPEASAATAPSSSDSAADNTTSAATCEPTSSAASPPAAAVAAPPPPPSQPVVPGAAVAVPRSTEVLLPVAPDVDVPDWVFARTPAEVKSQYFDMKRRREDAQVFRSRRSAAAAATAAAASDDSSAKAVAVLRIRFPEGLCLQGRFAAHEPLAAVHSWLQDALQPGIVEYELVGPDRRPLPTAPNATVRDAGLLPSCLLNFRPAVPLAMGNSCLRVELLQQTQADFV